MPTKLRDKQIDGAPLPQNVSTFVVATAELEPRSGNEGLSFVVGSNTLESNHPDGDKRMYFDLITKAGAFRSGIATGNYFNPSYFAVGAQSFGAGYNCASYAGGFAIGRGFANAASFSPTPVFSHAEGLYTFASGPYNHTEGTSCSAASVANHAEGWNTTAQADGDAPYSTATTYSHAEGRQTLNWSNVSHSQGKSCEMRSYGSNTPAFPVVTAARVEGVGALTWMSGQKGHCLHRVTSGGAYADPQRTDIIIRNETTDATPTELFIDGIGGSERIRLWSFDGVFWGSTPVSAVVLNAPGTLYTNFDTVTVSGGTYTTPADILIFGVDGGGGIAAGQYFINNAGDYTVNPTPLTANPVTGGTGSGATFDLTMGSPSTPPLQTQRSYGFKIRVTGRQRAGASGTVGDSFFREFKGLLKVIGGSGSATVSIVGAVGTSITKWDTGATSWVVAITADNVNYGIKVTVTGQASKTIRWAATCTLFEITELQLT